MFEDSSILPKDLPVHTVNFKDYMQNLMSENNNLKCECCPYGHHVNIDFVEFAKDLSNSHNELQKIRRYQRKLERAHNNLLINSDVHNTLSKDIINRSRIQDLFCSSPDSPLIYAENGNKLSSSPLVDDVIFFPNISEDCSSRSSEEVNLQSPVYNQKLTANGSDKQLSKSSVNQSPKSETLPRKSFIVSYEHLTCLREQMSASLKRVQELELEVKGIPYLRQKIDSMFKENSDLQLKIQQQNNIEGSYHQFNSVLSSFRDLSHVPPELLVNIERIYHMKQKLTNPQSTGVKSIQTETIKNHLIDSHSHFTSIRTNDIAIQVSSQQAMKRNFGVAVRPLTEDFTQQISPLNLENQVKPEKIIGKYLEWLKEVKNDNDRVVGAVLYNVLDLFFKHSFQDSISYLRENLMVSPLCVVSSVDRQCQTEQKSLQDFFNQTEITKDVIDKSFQAEIMTSNKACTTNTIETIDSSVVTNHVTVVDCDIQTIRVESVHKAIQTDVIHKVSQDFSCHFRGNVIMNNISSDTDVHLIDDLVSSQLERSIELIHDELRVEMMESFRQHNMQDACISIDDGDQVIQKYQLVDDCNSYENDFQVFDCQFDSDINSNKLHKSVAHLITEHFPVMIDSCISQDYTADRTKGCGSSLKHSNFILEDSELSGTNQINVQKASLSHSSYEIQQLPVDIAYNCDDEKSDSIDNSPKEAIYFTTDGKIEYSSIEQIEEVDESHENSSINENPKETQPNGEKVLMINSNRIKQDGDTPLEVSFSNRVNQACELVAQWMNDSTTTCSKDINESLAIIRQFWFELTKSNSVNLNYYLEKFNTFNPTLKERIINMVDGNGNTCLHYAVSDGRWMLVRQILETGIADVSRTNKAGYTVLMLAAVSDALDEDTLRKLISLSDIDKQSMNDAQQTVLMIAANQGKTKLVQLLLEAGSSVNITDTDGSTALMCACDNGHSDVVRLLLSRPDIDTELEDNTGSNAMKIALDNSYKDIALLIFAKNNLQKGSARSKRRSGSSSHPTSPLSQRKFK